MGLNEILKIGDKIRMMRKKQGLTQKEAAKALKIPYSTYSNYENNNRTPSMETLYMIAEFFEVDLTYFFSSAQKDDYYEFLDFFLNWASLRGYQFSFSHDDDTYLKNGGGQSIYITKDAKTYEFTPKELESYALYLNNYFDVMLMEKERNQENITPPKYDISIETKTD